MPPVRALAIGAIAAVAASVFVAAQQAGQTRTPAAPAAATAPAGPAADFVFPSGAGFLFFTIKTDRAADFEGVMARLKDALLKSTDAKRREQAAGWRVYKSSDPAPSDATTVTYVWSIDPAPASADYDPVAILREAFPSEAQTLYDRLQLDVVKVDRMGAAAVLNMAR